MFHKYEDKKSAMAGLDCGEIDSTEWNKNAKRINKRSEVMNLFVCAQCEKCMYLLYHNTVSHVSAYVEDTVHVHHEFTQPSA